ncbi:MAG TPA: hypothetical protein VGL11_20195 [Candidatus Binatia bacterium]|jgi:hypothetical protein
MKSGKFTRLIETVFAAKDDEILCSEFFEKLPRFVDLQIAKENAAELLADVHHHVHQCPECEEIYLALLEAVQSEK